jgi:hypothetical protein
MDAEHRSILANTIRELWKRKLILGRLNHVRRSAGYRATKPRPDENAWTLLKELWEKRQALGLDGQYGSSEAFITEGEGKELYRIAFERRPAFGLEIGFFHGYSTLHLLQGLADGGAGRLLSIDPYQYGPLARGVGLMNVRRAGLEKYHLFCPAASQFVLPFLCQTGFVIHFAFIDGNHLFDFTLLEFFYIDKMLAPGNPIVFHDYCNPSVYAALQFVEANLPYTVVPSAEKNLRILVKENYDSRPWYYFVPFKVPDLAWTSEQNRRPVEAL